MDEVHKNVKYGNIIFNMAFVLYFIQAFLNTTMYTEIINNNYFDIINIICILLILVKVIFFDNYDMFYIISAFYLTILVMVIFYTSNDHTPLSAVLFILGARNIDFSKFLKLYFTISFVLMILVILSSKVGWIINLTYYRGTTMRQALGFVYPTNFAAHVLSIFVVYLLIRNKRITVVELLIMLIVTWRMEVLTDARLDVAAMMIAVVIMVFYKYNDEWFNKSIFNFKLLIILWPLITGILVSLLSIFYRNTNSLMLRLNYIFSNRLYFGHNAYLKYGISIFGQKVEQSGLGGLSGFNGTNDTLYMLNYSYIDSSFFRILMLNGIIFFITILVGSCMINKRLFHYSRVLYLIYFALIVGCSIVDQHYLEISFNPFIVIAFANIATKGVSKSKERGMSL